ncbi:MAG TPA: DUF3072 domain-containing protein [Caldimonas sp.]|nr:DUF3072 domain-containing protein [Caldimonas sp.]
MTDQQTAADSGEGNAAKDPDDWVTGDEPMTGAQRSYLKTLSEEAKVPFDDSLTKAEASRRIEELQKQTGRGPAAANRHDSAPKQAASAPGRSEDMEGPLVDELDFDGNGSRSD